ncbi:MAG TPA: carbohydrate porin [Stellaceae bacterium]|nr:carbohydrate porin [Stellaceae bacterium]
MRVGGFGRVFAVFIFYLCSAAAGMGQVPGPAPQPGGDAAPAAQKEEKPEPPLLLGTLSSEFQKQRQHLKDIGITFSLQEESEVWANIVGGGHRGFSYDGRTTAKLDLDLDALLGWSGGAISVSAYDIHGHGPSRSLVGNQQLVSSLEATPSIKLYDLWFEQKLFDKKLSIRAGQEGADDELMITAYGGLYMNASFGFPGLAAADLPSGGPNYPLATPFARVLYTPSDAVSVIGAVYSGDPAPPGAGDPQVRDRNGTAFRLNDHTLAFGEVSYSPDPNASKKLPTTYKIGAWYATSNFADRRFDTGGGFLANPAGTGMALQHSGDWAVYGVVDQMVWQHPQSKDRGVGVFALAMAGPSDRNLSDRSAEAGINWYGPFAQRADDVAGLAVCYLGISSAARAFSADLVAFGQATSRYATNETVIEATYQAPLTGWLTLQPDLQYVIHPNAGIPNNFGTTPLSDALVIGLRATIKL